MASDRTHISEVDYAINEYYSKYIDTVVSRNYDAFDKARNDEAREYVEQEYKDRTLVQELGDLFAESQPGGARAALAVERGAQKAIGKGKFASKTVDDFLTSTVNEILNDKKTLVDLYGNLAMQYDRALAAKYGEKEYARMSKRILGKDADSTTLGMNYVNLRVIGLMKQTLARRKMPASSIEYIFQNAVSNSILLSAMKANSPGFKKTATDDEIEGIGVKMYNPNMAEKGTGALLGTVSDLAVIGGQGIGTSTLLKKGGSFFGKKSIAYGTGALLQTGLDQSVLYGIEKATKSNSVFFKDEKDFSKQLFGNENATASYQSHSSRYRKNGTEYIAALNATLERKIKVKSLIPFEKLQKEAQDLLRASQNSSTVFHKSIVSSMSTNALPFKEGAKSPDWMRHLTVKQANTYAANFFAIARDMQLNGEHTRAINGHTFTLAEVSQRANDYSKAASIAQEQWKLKKRSNVSDLAKNLIKEFSSLNIRVNAPSPKAWMLDKSVSDMRLFSNSFEKYAKQMAGRGQSSMMIDGKVYTKEFAAQRAVDYLAAIDIKNRIAAEEKAAKQKSHQHAQAKSSPLPSISTSSQGTAPPVGRASVQSGYATDKDGYQAQPSPYANQQEPISGQQRHLDSFKIPEGTEGWFQKNIDSLSMDGVGDVRKNLGYVLSMLPDMLIGMFTGKTPNMKLNDNILPLAMIFGGMYLKKSPLLRMLMVSYGGMAMLNNTNKALKADAAEAKAAERQKIYKTYPDEMLDRRMANPVVKGNTLIVDIDGKPLVFKVSNTAIDAYEKGAVPLNVLSNAVLHKYDEQQAMLSNNYESVSAREKEENRQNVSLR